MSAPALSQPVPVAALRRKEKSLWQYAWDRFRRNPLALIGLLFLAVIMSAAVFAPLVAPYNPNAVSLAPDDLLQAPSMAHLFGTDELGRDVFSRALFGARISLLVGFVATGVAIAIGVLVGAIAGSSSGKVDSVLMRGIDILMSAPLFVLVMISQIIIAPSIWSLMIVIGLISWMDVARLCRGEFLNLRSSEFVAAAKVVGNSGRRVAWRHVLPNASGPIIVAATLRIAEAIILESTLSFLGLGIQPPNASLGSMLQKGLTRLQDAPWLVWFPGVLIALTVLAFNFVGDGVRDALDPKSIK
ncbi:MAG: ABC transporter permease [Thermomicrobiales bacterium]|nr:ABC transporter permease [Thermomicrobiales bacterium]MCO5223365.1 ABC transporter permease [Thermomicrobiales bacterium]